MSALKVLLSSEYASVSIREVNVYIINRSETKKKKLYPNI